jgi:hypothetical protein
VAKCYRFRMSQPVKLSDVFESVDSPEGKRRVAKHLEARPFPHYESILDLPELLLRIEADGTRTVGRFVNRQFQKAEAQPR